MPTARFIKRAMAAACRTAIAKGVSVLKRRFVGNTFLRYCISYIIVLILPIVFIATSFNTRFIAGYRQSLTDQIKLTAQKTMGDLERQLGQMALIAPYAKRWHTTGSLAAMLMTLHILTATAQMRTIPQWVRIIRITLSTIL